MIKGSVPADLVFDPRWQQPPSLTSRLRGFVKEGTATAAPPPAFSALTVVRVSARIAALCCIFLRLRSTISKLSWWRRHAGNIAKASTGRPSTASPAGRPCVSRVTGRCTLQVTRTTTASRFNGHALGLTGVAPLTRRMPRTTSCLLLWGPGEEAATQPVRGLGFRVLHQADVHDNSP